MPTISTADRWRSLLDDSLDAVVVADTTGRCVVASPAAERLLGYGRGELLQAPVSDVVTHGLRSDGAIGTQALAGECWPGKLEVRCKNGDRIQVDGWSMRLAEPSGGAVAVFLRLAGQARAEELRGMSAAAGDTGWALRESEARFRGAFDAASIGMALVAIGGRFLQVNPALCGIVGYSEQELLRRTFQEITHPNDRATDAGLIQQLLANEITTYQIEKFYLRKDDEIICGRLTVSLVRGPGGEPLYFVSQIQDVTPFKAAGAALREAEARYRTLVEQTPACVYVDDANHLGVPLYISPRIESLLGYTPEEWLATPNMWTARVHPDDRERIMREIAAANQTRDAIYLEYRFLARNGGVVWVHDEATLIQDDEGSRQVWQGVMVDITDRKLAEEELRAAKEAAEEASRLKSVFLSMATHELRTPLTIISGYVELLAESAKSHLTVDEMDFLESAQAGTRTLAALVDDLLDLARIEAGRLDVTIRPVDAAETIDRVGKMVEAQAVAKGLELEIVVAPNLPLIAADANRLIQVLLNLFGNAIKFTERGRVRGAVLPAGAGVQIDVSDTGIGIAPEALPKIFDAFHQADSSTTRRFGGTGLGLSIARRLVEMLGGTIAVASHVGVGSTFTLWLPAADPGLISEETVACLEALPSHETRSVLPGARSLPDMGAGATSRG